MSDEAFDCHKELDALTEEYERVSAELQRLKQYHFTLMLERAALSMDNNALRMQVGILASRMRETFGDEPVPLVNLLVEYGLVRDRSVARRIIITGMVQVNGEPATDVGAYVPHNASVILDMDHEHPRSGT